MRAQRIGIMNNGEQVRPALTAVAWATSALVLAAPLALGGTRRDVQVPLAAGAFVCLALLAWLRLGRRGLRVPWPTWGAILLVGVGLVQLIPLPPGLIESIAPRTHEILTYSLGDLGLYDADHWRPLTLDPGSTWMAVFQQAAFVSALLLAVNAGARNLHFIEGALAYGAALVAGIGLVHWLTGADRIFGLYQAVDLAHLTGFFSTFINNNTLAGYLTLGTLIALGMAARAGEGMAQRRALIAAAMAGLGVVLSGSRGGHVALALGLLAFWAFAHAPGVERVDPARRRARTIGTTTLLLGLVALAAAFVLLPDWQSLGGTAIESATLKTEAKLAIWQDAVPYATDFWLTGSGRGTFAVVFPLYRTLEASGSVTHPENILLQWATEWGLIWAGVALTFALCGWVHLARGLGGRTEPAHWGALAGLMAVGVQQLADFGLESAGLALPVAAAFGVALARVDGPRPTGLGSRRRPILALVTLLGATAFAGLLAWRGPTALNSDPLKSNQALMAADLDLDALRAEAREAVADHPSDYLIPLTAAARIAEKAPERLPEVLRWVNRAMYLYPRGGQAHLLAARLFVSAGRASQAALEYRLAIEAQPWRANLLTEEVVARFRSLDRLWQATPETRPARLRLVDKLIQGGHPTLARGALERILAAAPDAHGARARLGSLCLKRQDDPCAQAAADFLVKNGQLAEGHGIRAVMAARAGEADAAHAALEAGASSGRSDPSFLRRSVQVHWLLRDVEAARDALDQLWRRVALDDAAAARTLALQGRIEADIGDGKRAVQAFAEAYERAPSPALALEGARHAERLSRAEDVRALIEAAYKRFPDHPGVAARYKALSGDPE